VGTLRWGLEEEVFITEPLRPTLQSLYYLARLLWRNPRKYYLHTACNFTRGRDCLGGLMSSVEISTGVHRDVGSLVEDLKGRRQELARACPSLLVPLGHLFDREEPTNISGMHIHISGFSDWEKAYRNVVYFLPLLALAMANSPVAGNRPFGYSYRWAHGFALGPLRPDRYYRFQDVIHAKRLKTLEIRVFDPVWDLDRIRILLECLEALVTSPREYPGDIEVYNQLRFRVAREGYIEDLRRLYRELVKLYPLPEDLLSSPPAVQVRDLWEREGTLSTYSALDNAYRNGVLAPRSLPAVEISPFLMLVGFLGYYLPRIPYNLKKVWSEW